MTSLDISWYIIALSLWTSSPHSCHIYTWIITMITHYIHYQALLSRWFCRFLLHSVGFFGPNDQFLEKPWRYRGPVLWCIVVSALQVSGYLCTVYRYTRVDSACFHPGTPGNSMILISPVLKLSMNKYQQWQLPLLINQTSTFPAWLGTPCHPIWSSFSKSGLASSYVGSHIKSLCPVRGIQGVWGQGWQPKEVLAGLRIMFGENITKRFDIIF